jgi:hypothetical protein
MKRSLSEILKKASLQKKVADRAGILAHNDTAALRKVLKYTFNEKITFDQLPEGIPPYKPNDLVDQENVLFAETRRLYLFTDGGNPNLKQARKEQLFIEILENVDKEDAKLLVGMKDKKLPEEYKGITKAVVEKAFPGLV